MDISTYTRFSGIQFKEIAPAECITLPPSMTRNLLLFRSFAGFDFRQPQSTSVFNRHVKQSRDGHKLMKIYRQTSWIEIWIAGRYRYYD